MKTCPGCQAEMAAEATYCPRCGALQFVGLPRPILVALKLVLPRPILEYAVILAFIAILVIVALKFLQPQISTSLNCCSHVIGEPPARPAMCC
jgi:hypothetical protein